MLYKLNVTVLSSSLIATWELCPKKRALSFFPFALYFYLPFLFRPLLPTHRRCRGLHFRLITMTYTHKHTHTPLVWTRDRPFPVTSTCQLQYSQETDISTPGGIRTPISASERPQNHTLDGSATGIGNLPFTYTIFVVYGLW